MLTDIFKEPAGSSYRPAELYRQIITESRPDATSGTPAPYQVNVCLFASLEQLTMHYSYQFMLI